MVFAMGKRMKYCNPPPPPPPPPQTPPPRAAVEAGLGCNRLVILLCETRCQLCARASSPVTHHTTLFMQV